MFRLAFLVLQHEIASYFLSFKVLFIKSAVTRLNQLDSISSEVLCDLRLRERIQKDGTAWKEEREMRSSQVEVVVGSRVFGFGHGLSSEIGLSGI